MKRRWVIVIIIAAAVLLAEWLLYLYRPEMFTSADKCDLCQYGERML